MKGTWEISATDPKWDITMLMTLVSITQTTGKWLLVLTIVQIQGCTVETTLSEAPGKDPMENLLSSQGVNLRTETSITGGSDTNTSDVIIPHV